MIIAKLNSGNFNLSGIKLIDSYLSYLKRKQRIKTNQLYSSWKDIFFGVPRGSISGPILFNIFLSDLLLIVYDINFGNDKAIYIERESID